MLKIVCGELREKQKYFSHQKDIFNRLANLCYCSRKNVQKFRRTGSKNGLRQEPNGQLK